MTLKKINPSQLKIIEELERNPKLSQWELSQKIGINDRNVRRNMRLLRLMGIVRRIGPNHKDGHWEIIRENL